MEILRSISLYAEHKNMPFVVIGGHAINAYGISRQTADLDLMVTLQTKPLWLELMKKLRYEQGQNDERFGRFRSAQLDNWPIDLMYVDGTTFDTIYANCIDCEFGETTAKVISQNHLIILKLHALKHYQEHRFLKDYTDLLALLKKSGSTISTEEFKSKCLKYASQKIYDRLLVDFEKNN